MRKLAHVSRVAVIFDVITLRQFRDPFHFVCQRSFLSTFKGPGIGPLTNHNKEKAISNTDLSIKDISGNKQPHPDDHHEDKGEDLEDMEEMYIKGPVGIEWGGPTRGGKFPEPTRYGDWERKGRATDF